MIACWVAGLLDISMVDVGTPFHALVLLATASPYNGCKAAEAQTSMQYFLYDRVQST
jgi:hypothetical protein